MSKEYLFTLKIRAMGLSWLRENGLDGINNQKRYRVLLCLENLPAIECWRDGLDEAQRRRLNHPNATWMHWRRSISAEASQQRQHVVMKVSPKAAKRVACTSIRWPQSTIKRAGDAMRQAWSNDVYRLATIALQAALRNEADILELLPPDPPAKPAPRQIAAPVALEVHA